MSVKCGNCSDYHEDVDGVVECYNGEGKSAAHPPTDNQMRFVRNLLEERAWGASFDPHWEVTVTAKRIIDNLPVRSREVSMLIEELKSCAHKSNPVEAAAERAEIPDGKYAMRDEQGQVHFWEVDKPTTGKWKGYTFISLLLGGPGRWQQVRVNRDRRLTMLEKIGADPIAAARLFGERTRTCGRCGSPLTDPRSRAAGYGEKCASILGWPYPSSEEALARLGETA